MRSSSEFFSAKNKIWSVSYRAFIRFVVGATGFSAGGGGGGGGLSLVIS